MSKPGNNPIRKKRPFFEDDHFAVFCVFEDSKIVAWEFWDKSIVPIAYGVKVFKVKNNQIKIAWQQLEKHANMVTARLLGRMNAKLKGPFPTIKKGSRPNNPGRGKWKRRSTSSNRK